VITGRQQSLAGWLATLTLLLLSLALYGFSGLHSAGVCWSSTYTHVQTCWVHALRGCILCKAVIMAIDPTQLTRLFIRCAVFF